ncbi:MAG TPA: winged helix-turn-helix domain-containing protein [Pyrinomonadaceae bacterium]|nr:winged helix-turn-helix domain-containing protein [Pyrinomonadaceae bacterium]
MSNKIRHLYEFDEFRVDANQKCLWHGEELVSLTPKAFDTLVVLLENKGRVVDKDTLLNQVWADTFVEEATLAQNISTLRKTFALQPNGKQFIETIPRRGYRFVGDVREIVDDEEIFVVETHRKTRIVSNEEIHNSAEIALTQTKTSITSKNKLLIGTGILACLGLLVGAYFAIRYVFQPKKMSDEQFREFQISKLTSSGSINKMAISGDGKYLALVEKSKGLSTLFLRQTSNANQIEVVPPTPNDFIGVTFSPDNEFIYYAVYQPVDEKQQVKMGVLYKVPILGGTRTEVFKDIDSPVSLSPDGKKYAFIRNIPAERQSALIVFDCSTTDAKEIKLTTRLLRNRFSEQGVSWSPDGKKIASAAVNSQDATNKMEIIVTNVETGEQISLTKEKWDWLGQLAWLADGSGIAVTSYGENSPNITDDIWLVSYPEGKSRQVTNGINGFFGLGITTNSNSLATVKSDRLTSLWTAPKDKLNEAKMVRKNTIDGTLFKLGLDWTPDGKIVYSTAQTGDADIWIMDADGNNQKQLTDNEAADFLPRVSADGRYIVFVSNRLGAKNLWRMNIDGTNPIQLTNLPNSLSPSISPDGNWVYFSAMDEKTNKLTLWKVSINGGEPTQFSELPSFAPQISPDGKYLACFYPENGEQNNRKFKLTLLSPTDAKIIKQFEISPQNVPFNWTADSQAISYLDNSSGISNIWLQPIDGSKANQLTNSETEDISLHSWSKDGNLVFVKETTNNDIVLVNNVDR